MVIAREHIVNFLLGGKCECIIRNTDTKNSFRFFIGVNSESKSRDMFFIHTYRDNKKVYAGFIRYSKDGITYGQGNKGLLSENDIEIKALTYVLKNALRLPNCVEVMHVGKCSRCGRKLTNPESISIGLGPECMKKTNYLMGA